MKRLKLKKKSNFKKKELPEKIMAGFIFFLLGLFLWDITFNGALNRTDFVEILKMIGDFYCK